MSAGDPDRPGPAAGPSGGERHLPGDKVLVVRWVPGSDTLLGICHCGAQHLAQSPVDVWEWLLGHPVGHEGAPGTPAPTDVGALAASV